MFIFAYMMMMMSMMFLFMKHPISMGVTLLTQTLFTAIFMNSMLMNAWFSYIMLLIMIGGLLILFIYMTSLMSNEKFKFNPLLMMINLLIILMSINFNFMDKFNLFILNKSYMQFTYNLNINFSKFLSSNFSIMIIMIIYLLIILIAVVKISTFKSGPIRQKF